jgi:hypothetical protein
MEGLDRNTYSARTGARHIALARRHLREILQENCEDSLLSKVSALATATVFTMLASSFFERLARCCLARNSH